MNHYSQRPNALHLYTHSPTQVNYNHARKSPPPVPLGERALLDLRRPNTNDALFCISALSPLISKRSRGNSETLPGRSTLLDKYLSQDVYQPNTGNSATTSRTTTTLPGPPPPPTVTSNQKGVRAWVSGTSNEPSSKAQEQSMNERIEREHAYVSRMGSVPDPQARRLVRNGPVPAPINIVNARSMASTLPSLRSPPDSASSARSARSTRSTRSAQTTPAQTTPAQTMWTGTPKAAPTPITAFRKLPPIKTVRMEVTNSPHCTNPKSSSYFPKSEATPSPTVFSPETPVAMTFEFPIILDDMTPLESIPMDQLPWDEVNIVASSEREKDFERKDLPSPRSRTRSLSPPRSAYPDDEAESVFLLPTTVYNNTKSNLASHNVLPATVYCSANSKTVGQGLLPATVYDPNTVKAPIFESLLPSTVFDPTRCNTIAESTLPTTVYDPSKRYTAAQNDIVGKENAMVNNNNRRSVARHNKSTSYSTSEVWNTVHTSPLVNTISMVEKRKPAPLSITEQDKSDNRTAMWVMISPKTPGSCTSSFAERPDSAVFANPRDAILRSYFFPQNAY